MELAESGDLPLQSNQQLIQFKGECTNSSFTLTFTTLKTKIYSGLTSMTKLS